MVIAEGFRAVKPVRLEGFSMLMPTLSYPVHSLDNLQILPAGAILSDETMDALVSLNMAVSRQTYSLLQHGTVKEDLLHFLCQQPYHTIFSNRREIADLLDLMENVYIILPVLQSLDYFKLNDFYTYHHILMVFSLSTLLSKDLISDYKGQIREIATSPNHDFGKICVPMHILRKASPLTRAELNIMKHHSLAGYVLLGLSRWDRACRPYGGNSLCERYLRCTHFSGTLPAFFI